MKVKDDDINVVGIERVIGREKENGIKEEIAVNAVIADENHVAIDLHPSIVQVMIPKMMAVVSAVLELIKFVAMIADEVIKMTTVKLQRMNTVTPRLIMATTFRVQVPFW